MVIYYHKANGVSNHTCTTVAYTQYSHLTALRNFIAVTYRIMAGHLESANLSALLLH